MQGLGVRVVLFFTGTLALVAFYALPYLSLTTTN